MAKYKEQGLWGLTWPPRRAQIMVSFLSSSSFLPFVPLSLLQCGA